MNERWNIHHGEALAWLQSLPSASADALITDPPYSSGGAFRGDRMATTGSKYVNSDSIEKGVDFAGDNRDQRSFMTWCTLWIGEALRVLRPGSPLVLFTDWRQLPTVTDALQCGGAVWRGVVPWIKPASRPQMGRFAAAAEYAVWGSAGPMDEARGVGCLPGFWMASSVPSANRRHQTEKPLEVMRQMVRITTPGGLILDPFAGSGTTGEAALCEGYRFAGCEMSDHYIKVARTRLARSAHDYAEGGQLPLLGDSR